MELGPVPPSTGEAEDDDSNDGNHQSSALAPVHLFLQEYHGEDGRYDEAHLHDGIADAGIADA